MVGQPTDSFPLTRGVQGRDQLLVAGDAVLRQVLPLHAAREPGAVRFFGP